MTGAKGVATANARKRGYVSLVENATTPSEDEQVVVVGHCVAKTAIRRSNLLKGIETTEGLACLPGKISQEKLKLWEAACVANIDLHSFELSSVLKV